MNYLVAVLPNRQKAESANSALRQAGLPVTQVSILGQGYQSADQFGLINPNQEAKKQSRQLSSWLIPFGFAAGFAFNFLTQIAILPQASPLLNHIIGGILGAGAGAMGAVFTGGAVGWTVGSGDALPYRNRLNAGKYLVVVRGTDAQIEQAAQTLKPLDPEEIQGYVDRDRSAIGV